MSSSIYVSLSVLFRLFLYLFLFDFFFNDTATTEIYTLSLHDALPISLSASPGSAAASGNRTARSRTTSSDRGGRDRKSTRLNSSHLGISYAVFCLKKKKKEKKKISRIEV